MDRDEFQKAYGKLVAKAWSDKDFKAKLLADSMTVFKENNVIVPEGIDVRMIENTDKLVHFVLPLESSDELTDGQLDAVVGGVGVQVDGWH